MATLRARALTVVYTFVVIASPVVVYAQGMDYATTVQLPTFNTFSVMTTVSVPDRGGAYLGGIGRASEGRSEYGVPIAGKTPGLGPLFGSRAIGREVSHSGVSVHATIIDHDELDTAVLAEARSRRSAGPVGVASAERRTDSTKRAGLTKRDVDLPFGSLASIRAEVAAEDERANREALELIAAGESAEQAGKWQSARSKYLAAASRATGAVKRQATTKAEAMAQRVRDAKGNR